MGVGETLLGMAFWMGKEEDDGGAFTFLGFAPGLEVILPEARHETLLGSALAVAGAGFDPEAVCPVDAECEREEVDLKGRVLGGVSE